MKKRTMLGALVAAAALAACGSGGGGDSGGGGGGDGDGGSEASGASGSDGSTDASPVAAGGVAAACNGNEGGAVPTSPAPLQAWLGTHAYKCWTHESVRHPSAGPHHGEVQTYLNAKLDASMKGAGEHAEGSVAVKEFYDVGGTEVVGWAVSVKTQPSSASGQGLYWYEAFGPGAGASSLEGQGKELCVNCHAGGKDFVLIPYPLR